MSRRIKKIGEGVYLNDRNELEMDIPEMLTWAGWEDTEENRDKMMDVASSAFGKVFPEVTQKPTHNHVCHRCRRITMLMGDKRKCRPCTEKWAVLCSACAN